MTPEPPLRVPRQEPFQRRWRPPPAVSDSPLRYGSRARAKRALSPEVSPCSPNTPEVTLSAAPAWLSPVSEISLEPVSTRKIEDSRCKVTLLLRGVFGVVEKFRATMT